MKIITVDKSALFKMFAEGKVEDGEIFEIRYKRLSGYGAFIRGQLQLATVTFGAPGFIVSLEACKEKIYKLVKAAFPDSPYVA